VTPVIKAERVIIPQFNPKRLNVASMPHLLLDVCEKNRVKEWPT
jgi:hypothetical protein